MTQEIKNTKSGTIGNLISVYNRTSDGQKMYLVLTLAGKAYWKASNCEAV